MSEDKKALYKRQLSLDGSNLGRAITSLSSIEDRWENLKPELKRTTQFLRGIKRLLALGGWEGYDPNREIQIPDIHVELPRRKPSEGFKIAKHLEALPELQRRRDEKYKEVSERLSELRSIHKRLIIAIITRNEIFAEEIILQRDLTIEEIERCQEEIMKKTEVRI